MKKVTIAKKKFLFDIISFSVQLSDFMTN